LVDTDPGRGVAVQVPTASTPNRPRPDGPVEAARGHIPLGHRSVDTGIWPVDHA